MCILCMAGFRTFNPEKWAPSRTLQGSFEVQISRVLCKCGLSIRMFFTTHSFTLCARSQPFNVKMP